MTGQPNEAVQKVDYWSTFCASCEKPLQRRVKKRRRGVAFCSVDCIIPGREGVVIQPCWGCGGQSEKAAGEYTKGANAQFCSRECYRANGGDIQRIGDGRPRSADWRPGLYPDCQPEIHEDAEKFGYPTGWTRDQGYIALHWKNHPLAGSNGRVAEHRAVAYHYVGDGVRGHHVDHKNADRSDNRWLNLQVLTVSDHMKKTAAKEGISFYAGFVKWVRKEYPQILSEYGAVLEALDTPVA